MNSVLLNNLIETHTQTKNLDYKDLDQVVASRRVNTLNILLVNSAVRDSKVRGSQRSESSINSDWRFKVYIIFALIKLDPEIKAPK